MISRMIVEWCTEVIRTGGYWGAGFLMALESMIAPIPSEAVMPPVGMLVKRGAFQLWLAVIATSVGSYAGSVISYYMGAWGGRPLVLKIGKYLLLDEHHLQWTEDWFAKKGGLTILIGRFVPVVRHLISIPAGIGRMSFLKFSFYTVIGSTVWNSVLLYVGYKFATYEEQIWEFTHRFHLDGIIVVLLVAAVIFLAVRHVQGARKSSGHSK